MESENPPDRYASPPQEARETNESVIIETLPERLGFIETTELRKLRVQTIEAMRSGSTEEVSELINRYDLLSARQIDKQKGVVLSPQLGLSIALALMRRDAGRIEDYIEALEVAILHADSWAAAEIIDSLETAQAQAVALVRGDYS